MSQKRTDKPRPSGWFARADHGFDRVLDAGATLAAMLLIAIMAATVIKVAFRYGLNEGLIGVDQISGAFMLYITFLGAAWVLRRDEHVTIDLLMSALPVKIKINLNIVSSLIGAVICFTVAVFGTIETIASWQRDVLVPAEIEYPRAFNIAIIPLGSLCLGLQFLRRARACWHGDASVRETPRLEA